MFFKQKKKKVQGISKELEKYMGELEKSLKEVKEELSSFKKDMRKAVTKVGIVRFNPFGEAGGDQSFVIALLDQDNSGVVVTSHYLQAHNRVYGKPLENGKSSYTLSREEEEAIAKALHE